MVLNMYYPAQSSQHPRQAGSSTKKHKPRTRHFQYYDYNDDYYYSTTTATTTSTDDYYYDYCYYYY